MKSLSDSNQNLKIEDLKVIKQLLNEKNNNFCFWDQVQSAYKEEDLKIDEPQHIFSSQN